MSLSLTPAARHGAAFVLFAVLAACGGGPTGPTVPDVRITSIQPTFGSTFGGTEVTISGVGFGANTQVTLGGVQATNVVINGATSITATTPARPAGVGDVSVNVSGRLATLPAAFTFMTPSVTPNAPPVVMSLVARGPRASQPAGMADLGEAIALTATVTDAESAPASLTYEWTTTSGTIFGSGPAVMLQVPATLPVTPFDATVTVTVVERYIEAGPQGLPITREHRVSRPIPLRIHDSPAEIRTMAERFLTLFSMSSVPTSQVLSDFSTTCDGGSGRADEQSDVDFNRCAFTITDYTVGSARSPVFHFGGRCTLLQKAQPKSDACTVVPVRWASTINANALSCPGAAGRLDIIPGKKATAEGLDQVTAVYEAGRWRLCHSTFEGVETFGVKFKR